MIELIKQLSLTDVALKYGIDLHTNQRNCPFCGSLKSFSIKDNRQFKCFKCSKGGSAIDLLIHSGLTSSVGESIKRLTRDFKLQTYDYQQRITNLTKVFEFYLDQACNEPELVREFCAGRGWDYNVVKDHLGLALDYIPNSMQNIMQGLGLLKNSRLFFNDHLVFAIRDLEGNIVHLSGRALDTNDDLRWKHLASSEGSPSITNYLYNAPVLNQELPYAILCEGITDCLSLVQLGEPAVGLFGIQSNYSKLASYFTKTKGLLAFLDRDKYSIGSIKSGEYKSWSCMIQPLADLSIYSNIPVYTLMVPNLPGIKDVSDFLKYIQFDRNRFEDYKIGNLKSLPQLLLELGDDSLIPTIWRLLSSTPDEKVEERLSVYASGVGWSSYLKAVLKYG